MKWMQLAFLVYHCRHPNLALQMFRSAPWLNPDDEMVLVCFDDEEFYELCKTLKEWRMP